MSSLSVICSLATTKPSQDEQQGLLGQASSLAARIEVIWKRHWCQVQAAASDS